jgi:hypothetical protein
MRDCNLPPALIRGSAEAACCTIGRKSNAVTPEPRSPRKTCHEPPIRRLFDVSAACRLVRSSEAARRKIGIEARAMIRMRPRQFYELLERKKEFLLAEIKQVKGLMPLLMKPRNGQRWTAQDKLEIEAHLRRLSRVSSYIAVAAMPGGLALLPLLAWWLDQRRRRRLGEH